jgi:hypothetical protein
MVKKARLQSNAGADAQSAAKRRISKKIKAFQPSAGEVRFGVYIAKKHKAMQSAADHDRVRTISSDAVGSLEAMTEHLLNSIVDNSKAVMRYTRTTAFNLEGAKAAAALSLSGSLKRSAGKAGTRAVEKYSATLKGASDVAAAPVSAA